jgi:hypothetical protein
MLLRLKQHRFGWGDDELRQLRPCLRGLGSTAQPRGAAIPGESLNRPPWWAACPRPSAISGFSPALADSPAAATRLSSARQDQTPALALGATVEILPCRSGCRGTPPDCSRPWRGPPSHRGGKKRALARVRHQDDQQPTASRAGNGIAMAADVIG